MSVCTSKSCCWIGCKINMCVFTHGNRIPALVARLKYEYLHMEILLLDRLRGKDMNI